MRGKIYFLFFILFPNKGKSVILVCIHVFLVLFSIGKMDYMTSFYNREGKAEHSSAMHVHVHGEGPRRAYPGLDTASPGPESVGACMWSRASWAALLARRRRPWVIPCGTCRRATMSRLARPLSQEMEPHDETGQTCVRDVEQRQR
jgi:hypothetical protein